MHQLRPVHRRVQRSDGCLLYTSDAADERSSVDLGGRRTIKKKKSNNMRARLKSRTHRMAMEDGHDVTEQKELTRETTY